MKNLAVDRLKQFIVEDLDNLRGLLMYKSHGKYYLFDLYVIEKIAEGSYKITRERKDPLLLSTLKTAVSWCIADYNHKTELANEILQLDKERSVLANTVTVRQHQMKKMKDPLQKEIAVLKILHRKTNLQQVENRLTKCVNSAKYWQTKGFNCDETARPRRTTTQR
jgi:hypothetical protein